MIAYRRGNDVDLDTVIELYRASTLGERRPVDDTDRMSKMLLNANLVITAWDGGLLVGISRALSDFAYATYCRTWWCACRISAAVSVRSSCGRRRQRHRPLR